MGYWPYKELFSDHKKPSHRIFFETGTYMGDSVQDAIDLGFETIISVEIEPHFFDESYKRFMPLDIWGPRPTETPELYLYKGDSSTMMPELLQKVNRPALFWLHAHRVCALCADDGHGRFLRVMVVRLENLLSGQGRLKVRRRRSAPNGISAARASVPLTQTPFRRTRSR